MDSKERQSSGYQLSKRGVGLEKGEHKNLHSPSQHTSLFIKDWKRMGVTDVLEMYDRNTSNCKNDDFIPGIAKT